MMTNAACEWVEAGTFESVTAAARRIREIEGISGNLFLQMLIEPDFGTDAEAFAHLEYTGKQALYVIKRRVN
ncbi:hypothetical protein [Rhodovastum atsumiense]|uniref:Uncharacterized protein n=1 Tax=Rhodovastum atsumiense TaxID=504468 RepID=A0A5M6IMS4_9PROT|nr:hypothetical protein [Rhodovastum atsumiense]KAA5609574.1 hypothetical protein F1189_23405 [Rhodovastum atsumiense]